MCTIQAPVAAVFFFADHGEGVPHTTGIDGANSDSASGLLLRREIIATGHAYPDDGTGGPVRRAIGGLEMALRGSNVYNYSVGPHEDSKSKLRELGAWDDFGDSVDQGLKPPSLIIVKGVVPADAEADDYLCLNDILRYFVRVDRSVSIRFYGCRYVV